MRHRGLRLLEKRGALPAPGHEDALQAYQAHALQQRLRWTEVDVRPLPESNPRCALLEGFSLHANTHLHAKDRQRLERLCRYGTRGALAMERLSRAEDSRIAWRMKRPLPDGTTHLFFTGLKLLRRVASLVPPPRTNLTRFHGVFAPGARLRPFLVPHAGAEEARVALPQAGAEEVSVAPQAAARKEPLKEKTPRVDFRGVAQEDVRVRRVRVREVWRQAAGAGVREGSGKGARDSGAPGLAHGRCALGPGARAPTGRGC
ncbi:transposase [Pyxidicoccus trucidator]|uniref:transposase n=1 Tax=Pyxidicoccus trucidator TaxID=2709662 RepID=UPI001F0715A2|nr:transposase [Pyxidicoccus trucidator]